MTHRPIPGYERYAVSASGEVAGVRVGALKQYTDKRGYKEVALYLGRGKGRKMMSVHRAVAIAWIPGNHSLTVNHKDGDKTNNSVDNLEWVTNTENMRHAYAAGAFANRGTRLGKSYAVPSDALQKLFAEIRAGASIRSTAIKHGVGVKTLQYQFKTNGNLS